MKRSNIFPAITTVLLSLAGVAATRHYGPAVMRYYVTAAGNYCKAQGSICTTGGTNQCYYTVRSPLFGSTRYALYTKGPDWYYLPGINCVNPVVYANPE